MSISDDLVYSFTWQAFESPRQHARCSFKNIKKMFFFFSLKFENQILILEYFATFMSTIVKVSFLFQLKDRVKINI